MKLKVYIWALVDFPTIIHAVNQTWPMAIGLMLSPFPVLALLIILMTANARRNSLWFMIGWFTGIIAVAMLAYFIPGLLGGNNEPTATSGWVRVAFGILLLIGANRQYGKRPKKGEVPKIPRLIARLDRVGIGSSLFTGFLLSGINVKNVMFIAGGTLTIVKAPGSLFTHAFAFIIFMLIGTTLLFLLLGAYFIYGTKSQEILFKCRMWLTQHVYSVLAGLLMFISALLFFQAWQILT